MDGITIVFLLFIIVIVAIVFLVFQRKLNDAVQNLTNVPGSANVLPAQQYSQDMDNNFGWVADFLIIMLLVGFPLVSMVLAFLNNIPPFLFYGSLGLTILVVALGAGFSTGFVSLIGSGNDTSVAAARMPMSSFVFSHFGVYAFFVVLLIILGVYVKQRSPMGYGP